jgi:hypothetical protein
MRIAALYGVEKDVHGRGTDERCAIRQPKGIPISDASRPWLRIKSGLSTVRSKSPRDASLVETCKLNDDDPLAYLSAATPGSPTLLELAIDGYRYALIEAKSSMP